MAKRYVRTVPWVAIVCLTAFAIWQAAIARSDIRQEISDDLIRECVRDNRETARFVEFLTYIQVNQSPVNLDSAPGFEGMPMSVQAYFSNLEAYLNADNPDRTDLTELANQFVEDFGLVRDCDALERKD